MSVLKGQNYTTIQGWMLTDLHLKGNELLIYAVIYGFSQAEGQVFNGSLRYLAEWTNSTKQGVMKNLKSLVEKGYIKKRDVVVNGVKFCEYYATELNGVVNNVVQGGKQSLPGGMQQSLPNNKEINNKGNIKDKKERAGAAKAGTYHKYGEYQNIPLTDTQLKKLQAEYPHDWQKRIEAVSVYCKSTGKKYSDYLATIRNWARRDAEKAKPKDEDRWYHSDEPEDDLPF